MKTLLRTLIYLFTAAWLGAEFFFPFLAAITFGTLRNDTHTAGMIVGNSLGALHKIGLISSVVLVVLLIVASTAGVYLRRAILPCVATVIIMGALVIASQFGVTPRMEQYRIEAGGDVRAAAADNPARLAFEQLHKTSEHIEEGIMLLGILYLFLLAKAEEKS